MWLGQSFIIISLCENLCVYLDYSTKPEQIPIQANGSCSWYQWQQPCIVLILLAQMTLKENLDKVMEVSESNLLVQRPYISAVEATGGKDSCLCALLPFLPGSIWLASLWHRMLESMDLLLSNRERLFLLKIRGFLCCNNYLTAYKMRAYSYITFI